MVKVGSVLTLGLDGPVADTVAKVVATSFGWHAGLGDEVTLVTLVDTADGGEFTLTLTELAAAAGWL